MNELLGESLTMKVVLFTVLLILLNIVTVENIFVSAQTQEPYVLKNNGYACALFQPMLMDAYRMALQKEEKIFVIASLGTGENNSIFNKARLEQVEMVADIHRFDKDRFILTQGNKIDGPGQLAVYVGSQLFLIVQANRGAYICATCEHTYNVPIKRKNRKTK